MTNKVKNEVVQAAVEGERVELDSIRIGPGLRANLDEQRVACKGGEVVVPVGAVLVKRRDEKDPDKSVYRCHVHGCYEAARALIRARDSYGLEEAEGEVQGLNPAVDDIDDVIRLQLRYASLTHEERHEARRTVESLSWFLAQARNRLKAEASKKVDAALGPDSLGRDNPGARNASLAAAKRRLDWRVGEIFRIAPHLSLRLVSLIALRNRWVGAYDDLHTAVGAARTAVSLWGLGQTASDARWGLYRRLARIQRVMVDAPKVMPFCADLPAVLKPLDDICRYALLPEWKDVSRVTEARGVFHESAQEILKVTERKRFQRFLELDLILPLSFRSNWKDPAAERHLLERKLSHPLSVFTTFRPALTDEILETLKKAQASLTNRDYESARARLKDASHLL